MIVVGFVLLWFVAGVIGSSVMGRQIVGDAKSWDRTDDHFFWMLAVLGVVTLAVSLLFRVIAAYRERNKRKGRASRSLARRIAFPKS